MRLPTVRILRTRYPDLAGVLLRDWERQGLLTRYRYSHAKGFFLIRGASALALAAPGHLLAARGPMTDPLRCPCCDRDADGLTLYSVAGVFRVMVCEACYVRLVSKERQPYSKTMQRLHRLIGLNGREVVTHAGSARCHTALDHSPSAVAQEEAQHPAVSVTEPGVGFVSRNTLTRRTSQ